MILPYFPVMNIHLKTFPDTESLIFQGLELFRKELPNIGKNEGVMLAGGRTPLEIYRRAAAEDLSSDLSRRSSAKAEATLFLSDERYVPSIDPQSNYGAILPMFGKLMRIKTELPIEEAAQAFHNDLNQMQSVPLGLLGLGADGHTASLFNLEDAALRNERLAIPIIKPEKPDRISITPTLLNRIERIIILATGAEKKEMIQTLLNNPTSIPAGVAIADHPNVELWTDQEV